MFSFGGDPVEVAVGLRRRWTLVTPSWELEARETEPARFSAKLILTLSERSACHELSSELELLPLSVGVTSEAAFCTMWSDERFPALEAFIERSGEVSSSEEKLVIVGGGGDPSARLERNPAWNLFVLGLISIEDCGTEGMGDDPSELSDVSAAR